VAEGVGWQTIDVDVEKEEYQDWLFGTPFFLGAVTRSLFHYRQLV